MNAKAANFDALYDIACQRKGGEGTLKARIQDYGWGTQRSTASLKRLGDDRVLSAFCKKIFQSGFVWRVVENKWDNFEDIFWGFNPEKLKLMPDEMLEQKAKDERIIRNLKKVWAIRENALFIQATAAHEGKSFSAFIADWPETDIVGLWQFLKKHGTRLGGNTGPYALRELGKDTFLFTRDVETHLRDSGVIDTGITTKSALSNSQAYFNELQEQSGWSLRDLSLLIALSTASNN